MIFYAGTRRTELLKKYIQDIYCKYCDEKTEHILILYCKAFVFGLFYPLKWWASKKDGYLICKKCGRETHVLDPNENIPQKVQNYFNETKIPFRYKFLSIALISSLIILGCFILFGFFSVIINVMTPINSKLRGKWEDEYSVYQMYIYNDKNFTVVGQDTIVYGNYIQKNGVISLNFMGKDNIIYKQMNLPLVLTDHENTSFSFNKLGKLEPFDDVFRKENNLWRTKANAPETNEQIRKKVLDYLQFEKNKLDKALKYNIEFILNDANAPVILAVNGIQVNKNSERKWKYLFYDEESWVKANEILHSEFPKEGTIDKEEENVFKRNAKFLQAYIENVKSSKLDYLNKYE